MALAQKHVDAPDSDPYKDLTWLGVVGFLDPPREEVRPALASCQQAGVRVVMVTGDHPVTARNIGLAVGLVEDPETPVVLGQEIQSPEQMEEQARARIRQSAILARVSPAQKLDLIALHQEAGAVVAMTGDGVNDAPALKKADIGVAMGRRGTQVAKEAADMVLKDDAFDSIVAAIEQGRVIFENIRRFVVYLLSCNISEIMVVSLAALVNAPLPIRPLQILFLNLVTDVFPALALGVGEGDESIMRRPPRDPQESIVTRRHWWEIALYGGLITASVLVAFALAYAWLDAGDAQAVTIAFLTLAFAQLWHVFNMREAGSHLLRNEITANRFVWGALALCTGLLLAAVYLPVLSDVLGTVDPGWRGWLLVASASLAPLLAGPAVHWLLDRR
jgi:Ca2+-transporting ATPase